MEDKTRALIVTGAVLLLILALIIAAIFYLIRFIQGRSSTTTSNTQTRQINFSPSPSASMVPNQQNNEGSTNQVQSDIKIYNGTGFQLTYPKNWGLLSCNNSQNIEFDPYNSTDQLGVKCDYAQKPITVLVGTTCSGTPVDIGGVAVVKTQRNLSKGVENSWCVSVGSGLMITNRVSSQEGSRGYGKDDYSTQIEQMIAHFRAGSAS